jgi:hypothetical protein
MPMNSTETPVNKLTGSHVDKITHTPAYKETSVNMRVLESGENPLPRINSRFGHPTPKKGVEVEQKWKRPDYRIPGTSPIKITPREQARTETEKHLCHPSPTHYLIWPNLSLWNCRRAIRARNYKPGCKTRPLSMPRPCWPPTRCCRDSMIEGIRTDARRAWLE